MKLKPQRVRDPLHNLIEFDTTQLHETVWQVIQTPPFQRLRRVRQLGFSEFVYPGATHTRFSHSIGVFHTAQRLMKIIKQHVISKGLQPKEHQEQVALVAALVHDVGHGMFSHAFEDVGKRLQLQMAEHEYVSDRLIRDSEIAQTLNRQLGSGFANDVADVIGGDRPGNLYDAVVSSQFDADRLDYMQRDRLMTGVQNSGIDFVWLMNNLEIAEVPVGADDEQAGTVSTFVLGPKALHAAETYVVALFQLYPTVYFHKATRGAEKLFSEIMVRLFQRVQEGSVTSTGLALSHPLVRFAKNPEDLSAAMALDDSVFWGALPLLVAAKDPLIGSFSARLWHRNLFKCIDVRQQILERLDMVAGCTGRGEADVERLVDRVALSVQEVVEEWFRANPSDIPRLLIDQAARHPYKRYQESTGPLSQINIRQGGRVLDIAEASPMIAGLKPFKLFRIYYDPQDAEVSQFIEQTIGQKIQEKI